MTMVRRGMLATAGAVALMAPASAEAAVLVVTNGAAAPQFTYLETPGEWNRLVVRGDTHTLTFNDVGAHGITVIGPGDGTSSFRCTSVGTSARCQIAGTPVSILAMLGTSADTYYSSGTNLFDVVHGGEGNDVLRTGPGLTEWEPHSSHELWGDEGDDVLQGGPTSDRLFGGLGADRINGAGGGDFVDYADVPRPTGVTVSLDGAANDGGPSEGDNLGTGIDIVSGTPLADHMTARAAGNEFYGLGGDDVLRGGRGVDVLAGYAGNDDIDGGGGGDDLTGDDGDDLVRSADGERDRVACGTGTDAAIIDVALDDLDAFADPHGCETVNAG